MPIIRRSNCVPLPIGVCPVVTLQHHNSYNRTDNYRQGNAVESPDDGHKDARNMLRYYRLPINHYLLQLVGFSFTYLSKMHGHTKIKIFWTRPIFCEIKRKSNFEKREKVCVRLTTALAVQYNVIYSNSNIYLEMLWRIFHIILL